MAGNLDRFVGISQTLQPLLIALGKMQGGDANALKQFRDFVSDNADQILQARPLLESESLLQLVRQFVPTVNEKDFRKVLGVVLELAEQTAKKRP